MKSPFYAATLATVVVVDLLSGILVGIGLAVSQLVYRFSHLSVRVQEDVNQQRTVLYLEGAATFIRLAATLQLVPPSTDLHVHFEGLTYIDHACLDLLMNWEKQHEATGGSLTAQSQMSKANGRLAARDGKYNVQDNNGQNLHARTIDSRSSPSDATRIQD